MDDQVQGSSAPKKSSGLRLQAQKDNILKRWEEQARRLIPAAKNLNSKLLRNSFSNLLDEISDTLLSADPKSNLQKVEQALAQEHGEERYAIIEYDLSQMIEEYQILRKTIFEVLRSLGSIDEQDQDIILDAITFGIRNATNRFLKLRELQSKKSNLELRAAEESRRLIMDGIKDHAIMRMDSNGIVLDWNPGAENIFGYTKEEVLNQDSVIFFTPEDRAVKTDITERRKAVKEGRAEDKRWHVRKDGSRFFANGIMNPLVDLNNELLGFVKVLRDETDRELIQERLRSTFADASVGVAMTDIDFNFIQVNKAFAKITGYTEKELRSKRVQDLTHPEDWPNNENLLEKLRVGSLPIVVDKRYIKKDGTIVDVRNSVSATRDHKGEITGVVALSEDVTEQRRVQEALRKAESEAQIEKKRAELARQELHDFFMQAPIALCMLQGPDHKYILANPKFLETSGRNPVGKTVREAFTEKEAWHFIELLDGVYKTGEPFIGKSLPFPRQNEKGETTELFLDVGYHAFREHDGAIKGILAVVNDVTERVKAEQYLSKVAQNAEEANAAKSSFLANMSHEIRTPMTAVLGFTEILRDPELTKSEREDAISRIETSGRSLLRIIDDVLDISKIEAGKLAIRKSKFSPVAVATDVAAIMRLSAEQKGLTLKLKTETSVPTFAFSDPARIRQILLNLLGNAIKFTSEGEVILTVKSDRKSQLVFDVLDTGIGIAESDQLKLFQPFAQADESISRKFGGTGLGLLLSRRLAEQMGGRLVLTTSKINQGSRFTVFIEAGPFEIDLSASPLQGMGFTPNLGSKTSLEGVRILLAEDAPDNRVLMSRYLTRAGAEVRIATNGEEALSLASSADFDIVLMDIQMPKMDGIQATKTLRSQGYQKPILALTAHAMQEEVHRSLEAGFDDHLTKPITGDLLISHVRKHVPSE